MKFKVLDWTEPTLSMPMLVANGNRVILRGEVATLITAEGETAPLMNGGNDWFLKVLINNNIKFLRIDVWTLCHRCPPSWVRNLSSCKVNFLAFQFGFACHLCFTGHLRLVPSQLRLQFCPFLIESSLCLNNFHCCRYESRFVHHFVVRPGNMTSVRDVALVSFLLTLWWFDPCAIR